MIKAQNLSKTYLTEEIETTAVNRINLEIKPGEFTAIMGPSGCGKSTLLNILGLLDNPSDGHYFFMDENVLKLTERQKTNLRKSNIGFIFQSFNLIEELTIFENIELPLLYLGVKSDVRNKKVDDTLERVGIIHRRNHFPQQLSGGQQQRAAVARAIIAEPKLILADEPTGNLDSKNGDDVMDLLSQLNANGSTIIMVTHSPTYAERSHRVIHLFDGQIITENVTGVFHL